MKILVTAKRVIDREVGLQIDSTEKKIRKDNAVMITNPFDEIALEEALRIIEKHSGETCVLSIGMEKDAIDQIRFAFAMGIDRGLLIKTDEIFDNLNISKIIAKIVQKEKPDIVLMGKQSIDDDCNQVAQMLAERLELPQITQANKIVMGDNMNEVIVTREIDDGFETLIAKLPCVISCDLRLNEPRHATLPNIIKSKKKIIEEIELKHLELNLAPNIIINKLEIYNKKTSGIIFSDVESLIKQLHETEKVI